ncbi:diacylglycerol kinase family enzyme [Deinobacterium chartae]|uniref:Diacylglycerol kinase family enzyme n=1 Tax=Deinobacterium chartae TaxID=521158 RepID=A0A841HXP2_9DEIO|nr:diacylglycerol kinase family enzyme [Deinobacterium chartae]
MHPGQTKTSQRLLVIHNPKSGQGSSGLDQFLDLAYDQGYDLFVRQLDSDNPIDHLTKDAEEFDAVVAAGGDGTVSCTAHALQGRGVPLLTYPAGTANLIAQNLHLPTDPQGLLTVLESHATCDLDLGELSAGGRTVGFSMAAGAGIDAEMIRESEALKDRLGVAAYVVGVLKKIGLQESALTLTLDGRRVETHGVSVLIANFGLINFGLPIAPGIDPADGLFTVVVLKGKTTLDLLPHLIDSVRSKLGLGDPAFAERLELHTCRELILEADPPLEVQYDGELMEATTPLRARVLPGAARFICMPPPVETDPQDAEIK